MRYPLKPWHVDLGTVIVFLAGWWRIHWIAGIICAVILYAFGAWLLRNQKPRPIARDVDGRPTWKNW